MAWSELSTDQARRITLCAQGFSDPKPVTATMRTVDRTIARVGIVQIDSVNVLQRAHYMPLWSRIGRYDTRLLTRASEGKQRRLVEYWAHVQAFMPIDLWPYMQHRREHYRHKQFKWWRDVPEGLPKALLDRIRDQGPSTAKDLDDGARRTKENWGWNWSNSRIALDFMFMTGELAVAGRTRQFEPRYDVVDRVIDNELLDIEVSTADQHRELVRRAIRSMGVGTAAHVADYHRMKVADTTLALNSLIDSGEVERVRVQGIRQPAYLHTGARLPRQISASTLLSPFDPVVWERDRTEKLFDFTYRIEIYTPKHKRIHGYYVLPFLLGDRIVARVDLKADRSARRLLVHGAFAEPGAPDVTATELAAELRRLADWLDLDVMPRHVGRDPATTRSDL